MHSLFRNSLAASAFLLSCLIGVGCSKPATNMKYAYTDSAEAVAKAAMDPYDLNKDGKLDGNELAKAPHFREFCQRTNRKTLSLSELTERVTAYQTNALIASGLTLRFFRKDVPLADAEIVATPEDFQQGYPTLKGKTDSGGNASLVSDSGKIPYGFYKISVTKPGESISAQYNTATSLRLLFFPEAGGRGGPVEFRLTN